MTICTLHVLLSWFGTSLLFHVQFYLLLLDMYTDFSGGMTGGLAFHLCKNFPQFVVNHTFKGFGIVNKAEVAVFLELPFFFKDPKDVGNLISGSSVFSTSSLNIWNFIVHILLKPGLDNFEHSFTNVWDECTCVVVWAFFGIAFLWDWNENWLGVIEVNCVLAGSSPTSTR